ncbi:MAG: polysaccharide deacetylase family protein [Bacilli bacterium]|nr:polysaccharide deacetylase family protein [Bacilli bacterium]
MKKKVINAFVTITMILASFMYTNNVIRKSREKDPIMININKDKALYEKETIEATIKDNELIPGISGMKVNVDSSYSKMKQKGSYDKSLYVFDEVKPEIISSNDYDDYIVSGNNTNPYVSLIFVIKDTDYVEDILKILNEKEINATFFLDKSLFDNSIDLIKSIVNFGNDVELLSNNYSIYEVNKYNSILRLVTKDKLSFCYFDNKNDDIKKNCKESKLNSVIPNINTDSYIYSIIKNKMNNGSIIEINNNLTSVKELKSTISYIFQKGKKIVLLKKLIEE